MPTNRLALGALLLLASAYSCSIVNADTLASIIRNGHVSGVIRSYYFSKLYGAQKKENADAYSLGGIINAQTGNLAGFSADVSFFTANALGTHDADSKGLDATLMGIAPAINALGQAYLQYQLPKLLLLRVGNQFINTPWLGARDSRMLPQIFQGIYLQSQPVSGLHLIGMRIFRWKSRTSDNYYRDNLYYNTGYQDDPLYGIKKVGLPKDTPASNGTLAFGATYDALGARVAAWYYNFYQFAQMFYGSAQYSLHTGSVLTPYVAAQFMREWEANGILQHYDAKLFGQKGTVNATLWGGKLGVKMDGANLFFAYNALIPHADSFGGGAIVSPYGNYAMYASFMTNNLLAFGPGHAWRLGASYRTWQKQLRFLVGYARFDTNYEDKTNGVYLDLTYFPKQLHGLSIRDRVAIDNGLPAYDGHSFIYNRLMLQYAF